MAHQFLPRWFLARSGASIAKSQALALGLAVSVAASAACQPLSTEADLHAVYEDQIVSFWARQGQRHDIIGVDGVRLTSMVFRHPHGKDGIVIANGYGESLIKYREVVFDLWHAGFDVYILDHRGQGLSERLIKPDRNQQADPVAVKHVHDLGHVENFDDFVADLKQFVEKVAKPGSERLYLVGHSMGGAIASLYLETHQWDFAAAALSAPMHEPQLHPVPNSLCVLFALAPPRSYIWGYGPYAEPSSFNADRELTSSQTRYDLLERNELRDNPQAQLGGPSFRWAYESCNAARRSIRDAGRITVPVLLFQAGNDRMVKPTGQKKFCEAVNRSASGSCRLEIVRGARHELLIESDAHRNRVMEQIIAFFKGEGGPSHPFRWNRTLVRDAAP